MISLRDKTENKNDFSLLSPDNPELKRIIPKYKVSTNKEKKRVKIKGTKLYKSEKILKCIYKDYAEQYPWIKIECFKIIHPKEKKFICIQINNKNVTDKSKIMFFTKGEIGNVCGNIPFLVDLSTYFKCNILTFEYPKIKDKTKSETETLQCVLSIITYIYSLPYITNIILIGYSVGVYLNYKIVELLMKKKKNFNHRICAFINISPLWSYNSIVSKKIFHNKKGYTFIKNIQAITNQDSNIRTFVVHGQLDHKLGYILSMNICSKFTFVYEWYPKEGDHYNTIYGNKYRTKLLRRLKDFLYFKNDFLDLSIFESSRNLDEYEKNDNNELISQKKSKQFSNDLKQRSDSRCSGNFYFKNDSEKKLSIVSISGNIRMDKKNSIKPRKSGFSIHQVPTFGKGKIYNDENNKIKDDINIEEFNLFDDHKSNENNLNNSSDNIDLEKAGNFFNGIEIYNDGLGFKNNNDLSGDYGYRGFLVNESFMGNAIKEEEEDACSIKEK